VVKKLESAQILPKYSLIASTAVLQHTLAKSKGSCSDVLERYLSGKSQVERYLSGKSQLERNGEIRQKTCIFLSQAKIKFISVSSFLQLNS
jgi:hypothetical protein